MRPIVSAEEMRRADEAAIEAGTRAEVLMDRAGHAVARTVLREAGARYGRRVTVVCGKGNNGGDGFVVARVLHQEGLRVVCCTTFDPHETKGAAAHHLDLLRSTGCPVVRFDTRHLHADVIVDAVFGTGFHGEPEGEAEVALRTLEHAVSDEAVLGDGGEIAGAIPVRPRPRVVSIDVPSAGIVPAHVTVALGAEKFDTFFGDAGASTRVEVADIGIPVEEGCVYVLERDDIVPALPELDPDDHKTSHGSVAVLAGSEVTTGAALLVARAAARMGAGYVTLVSTAEVIRTANVRLPEVLKRELPAPVLGPDALDAIADVIDRADAVAVGPGLGRGPQQTTLVERCLRELDKPLVLDADALNALAGKGDLIARREWPCVLTPHVAEMARLLGIETSQVVGDRAGTALRAAADLGCTVVLKGRNTLVATRYGGASAAAGGSMSDASAQRGPATAWAVPVGGPELATAGTGDVLTGAVAATIARRRDPHEASAVACYVHGRAGVLAADLMGATGVVAWDVAEVLPLAVRSLRTA